MTKIAASTCAENGPPPDAAAAFYAGKVMHHRMKPKEHRFTYDVFNLLIDIDRLVEAERMSPFFSVNGFNLLSFNPADHGPRDGSDLRYYVNARFQEKGVVKPDRVLLLCYPRVLGYVFNPLSVYYGYDAQGTLTGVIYEVRNTFGDLHSYVHKVEPGHVSEAGIRQDQRKVFYVSPFIDMEQHYHFRLLPPGKSTRVRILETDPQGPLLSATFTGNLQDFATPNILRLCLRMPLLTFKVIAAIHWEAFKIWRKRIRFHPRSNYGPNGTIEEPNSCQTFSTGHGASSS
ncbi:hypothetical protein JM93_00301 [Roseibium hamelinense]|uniref:DUF1365 family protein n=1 Tax=Roseibium hamelinense TaxID=150831 RepID=A0A562TGQ3_9HYPH|nr:DUF1365 domain-containing protein [Roseibium hamelinense]MTI46053.1 DUF1365 domain-containing protein [Roseibium hamelinense]TWI92755.1 hypothetical protein JM93_00301 [Roseibium hamelinense]